MLSKHHITKEQVTAFVSNAETTDLDISNSRFGIGIILSMACITGIWGCICLISAIAQSQSISELGRGLVTAITGI